MVSLHWLVKIRALSRNLTIRATAFAVIAIISSFIAIGFSDYIPTEMAELLGGSATRDVLDILAKSMLVVVTFSMSTLIATYSMITGSTTPRATKLVMQDASAHNALSTFLGAFIYSVVSIVSLSTNLYGPKGRVILFAMTIIVIGIVIATIIRWIGRLSKLGHLENLIKEIEEKIMNSVNLESVLFEWNSPSDKSNNKKFPLTFKADVYGPLQSLDMDKLTELAEDNDLHIYIDVNVGDIVGPGSLIADLSKDISSDKKLCKSLESCFYVGDTRTFDEDPLYGMKAISELASRALSPGVNDPGTAIQVIQSLTRIMCKLTKKEANDVKRVYPKAIKVEDIFDNSFSPILRDAEGNIEVLLAIQESFLFLSGYKIYEESSSKFIHLLRQRAKKVLSFSSDFEKLNKAFESKKEAH